eukprot:2201019-Rhodomonas_salina.1
MQHARSNFFDSRSTHLALLSTSQHASTHFQEQKEYKEARWDEVVKAVIAVIDKCAVLRANP